jgi:uncharacterized protein YndB with AHSA1/START domain
MTEPSIDVVEHTETVWRYWTDPVRMLDWWGAAELDPRPGGVCRVAMDGGPVMRGEYIELVPYKRVVFSFGWEPSDGTPDVPPGSTRVEVTLTADGGDTIVTLRHSGLPSGLADLHGVGWHHVLAQLVAVPQRGAN